MGARLLSEDAGRRAGRGRRSTTGARSCSRSGSLRQPRRARRLRGRARGQGAARAAALGPRRARRRIRCVLEKLMPVLGLVRSPSVEHALDAAELVTEHGGLGHTSAVYAYDESVIDAFAKRVRTGRDPGQRADRGGRARRRLQRDDADVLARLRHLGRLAHNRQHQLPQPAEHQGGLAPAGAAAVVPGPVGHVLQPRRTRQPAHVAQRPRCSWSPTSDTEARGVVDELRRYLSGGVRVFAEVAPEPTEDVVRAGVSDARDVRAGPRRRARRRLGPRRGQGDAAVLREPRAVARASSRCRSSTPASASPTSRRSSTRSGSSRCRPPRAPARRSPPPPC